MNAMRHAGLGVDWLAVAVAVGGAASASSSSSMICTETVATACEHGAALVWHQEQQHHRRIASAHAACRYTRHLPPSEAHEPFGSHEVEPCGRGAGHGAERHRAHL
jgi:hypothetical protein